MDIPETLATLGTQDKDKQKNNTICVRHHYAQANTINVNKTCTLLQTTRGKDEPNVNKTWSLLQTTGGKDEPNVNKTWALLQTTRGKDEPKIVNFYFTVFTSNKYYEINVSHWIPISLSLIFYCNHELYCPL